ncbi:tetratricopeptide repeat protein [Streptomyces sp. CB01635]|uniref:tetratricopeptide repeat protein n=1 Tax=unclassified Streptomyces TaxID=2593676 RepID=UPI001F356318|nr:tetratricopeptide repeat protein [Streptomyces sp. CB01635]
MGHRPQPGRISAADGDTNVDLVRFRSEVDQARTGTPEEAKGRYEQALALWRGRPFAGLKFDWLDGYRLALYAEGEDHCLQALPLLQHHGDGEGQAATWDTLGHIARHTGRTERALHSYGESLTHFQSIGNANREADTWSKLGDIHAERGEDARAREAWTAALALYREQGRSAAAHRMTTNLATGGPG